MTEPIFERILDETRQAASHWFHPRHQPGVTMTPAPRHHQETPMSLAALANDIKTAVEEGETRLRTILDQHMPTLTALADRVENDPLIQAVEAAMLPPGVRQGLADMISKLAAEFPQTTPTDVVPAPITTAAGEPAPAQ